jgi:nucleoid-associated protein YgaU
MDRRIKLAIAAIALGLLVAGMVRRWTKEGHATRKAASPDSSVASHELPLPDRETPPVNQSGEVSPAFAQLSAHATEFPKTGGRGDQVTRATYLPNSVSPEIAGPTLEESRNEYQSSGGVRRSELQPSLSAAPTFQPPPYSPITPSIQPGHYVTQPNDSFWSISQRVYGTGRYFQALYEHNRRLYPQPDRLPPGVTIETPESYLLERSYPDLFR